MNEIDDLMRAGKLETTCPDCGRWSAAVWRCSWCYRALGPEHWYRNGDQAQRAARMPTTAPANPPSEYRHSVRDWPTHWGPYPGQARGEAVRVAQTPVKRGSDAKGDRIRVRLAKSSPRQAVA